MYRSTPLLDNPLLADVERRLQLLCNQIDSHFGVSEEELCQFNDPDSLELVSHTFD